MCGAHDAIYELTAYRDPNLIPIKAFYGPCPKVNIILAHNPDTKGRILVKISSSSKVLGHHRICESAGHLFKYCHVRCWSNVFRQWTLLVYLYIVFIHDCAY